MESNGFASWNASSTASITFHPNQDLLPAEKLTKALDSAMIDMVNMVGVNLEDATNHPYVGNLLPFVCGLGPRKAQRLLETISHNGGVINSRGELVVRSDAGRYVLRFRSATSRLHDICYSTLPASRETHLGLPGSLRLGGPYRRSGLYRRFGHAEQEQDGSSTASRLPDKRCVANFEST